MCVLSTASAGEISKESVCGAKSLEGSEISSQVVGDWHDFDLVGIGRGRFASRQFENVTPHSYDARAHGESHFHSCGAEGACCGCDDDGFAGFEIDVS